MWSSGFYGAPNRSVSHQATYHPPVSSQPASSVEAEAMRNVPEEPTPIFINRRLFVPRRGHEEVVLVQWIHTPYLVAKEVKVVAEERERETGTWRRRTPPPTRHKVPLGSCWQESVISVCMIKHRQPHPATPSPSSSQPPTPSVTLPEKESHRFTVSTVPIPVHTHDKD